MDSCRDDRLRPPSDGPFAPASAAPHRLEAGLPLHGAVRLAVALALLATPAAAQSAGPVLEIGRDPSGPAFYRIRDIAVSPAGDLWVLDAGDRVLRVFDPGGGLLREVGREGAGPGEFLRPTGIRISDSGVTVSDGLQQRLSTFDLSGRHVETRALPEAGALGLTDAFPLRDGYWIGVSEPTIAVGQPVEEIRGALVLYRPGTGAADTITRFHRGVAVWREPERGGQWGIVGNARLGPEAAWAVAGDSLVAIVDGYEGAVVLLRPGEAPRTAARLPIAPAAIGPAELERLEEDFRAYRRAAGRPLPARVIVEPPPYRSQAVRALFSDTGALWVQRGFSDPADGQVWLELDFGRARVSTVRMPPTFTLHAVSHGRLIGSARTTDEVHIVQVFGLHR